MVGRNFGSNQIMTLSVSRGVSKSSASPAEFLWIMSAHRWASMECAPQSTPRNLLRRRVPQCQKIRLCGGRYTCGKQMLTMRRAPEDSVCPSTGYGELLFQSPTTRIVHLPRSTLTVVGAPPIFLGVSTKQGAAAWEDELNSRKRCEITDLGPPNGATYGISPTHHHRWWARRCLGQVFWNRSSTAPSLVSSRGVYREHNGGDGDCQGKGVEFCWLL